MISSDPSDRDIVKHLSCDMRWLAAPPSSGVLLAPGLLKFTLVNTSRKPHAQALAAPLKFRPKLFFAPLLVVTILLAFASWPAHSQGIYVPTDVGGPGISGSVGLSAGTYTLTGGGSDIGGTSDQFFFSYQQLTDDFDMR